MENRRRYFEYTMGDTRINNFFSFLSGRFNVQRDKWKDVNLQVYYNPGYEFDVDKMMESAKAGSTITKRPSGRSSSRKYRVLEFPRYRGFAQSFPNTIPFSESIGFIERLKKKDLLYL